MAPLTPTDNFPTAVKCPLCGVTIVRLLPKHCLDKRCPIPCGWVIKRKHPEGTDDGAGGAGL